MLQLFFAVAFSAVPLTLYLPPIRSLNLFVVTLEEFLRQTALYTLGAYPRVRHACVRLFNSLVRLARIGYAVDFSGFEVHTSNYYQLIDYGHKTTATKDQSTSCRYQYHLIEKEISSSEQY
ncbi:hypothetical protein SAY87_026924 [Trapa incisa]|uniref:Uncharacterized protein n=2 Tax=Trapa TaxID=22665 RepID=A0AAN7MX61_TRANT|nr:hypothetical protein SAY87_026924 [Trapa incisa]KAK4799988.1 hypothetical protein SAY86_025353 [Trapa natans]